MTVLAVDSSTPTAAVALCRDGDLLASFRTAAGSTHSACLLPMIENTLSLCGVSVADVDLFVCGVGPGSFTGVRIAVATVKGLAAPLDKPCVGVSSLELCAAALAGAEGLIVPVFNARRGNVYSAVFSSSGGGLSRLGEDMIISVAELCEMLRPYGRPVYFAGDSAREVYAAARDSGIDAAPVSETAILPDAAQICAVAAARYEAAGDEAKRAYTADALTPVYLRPGRVATAALPE